MALVYTLKSLIFGLLILPLPHQKAVLATLFGSNTVAEKPD